MSVCIWGFCKVLRLRQFSFTIRAVASGDHFIYHPPNRLCCPMPPHHTIEIVYWIYLCVGLFLVSIHVQLVLLLFSSIFYFPVSSRKQLKWSTVMVLVSFVHCRGRCPRCPVMLFVDRYALRYTEYGI